MQNRILLLTGLPSHKISLTPSDCSTTTSTLRRFRGKHSLQRIPTPSSSMNTIKYRNHQPWWTQTVPSRVHRHRFRNRTTVHQIYKTNSWKVSSVTLLYFLPSRMKSFTIRGTVPLRIKCTHRVYIKSSTQLTTPRHRMNKLSSVSCKPLRMLYSKPKYLPQKEKKLFVNRTHTRRTRHLRSLTQAPP